MNTDQAITSPMLLTDDELDQIGGARGDLNAISAGASAGAAIGGGFGPLGSAIGGAVGGLLGWLFG